MPAAITPELLTVNALEPTVNNEPGVDVPIPTLPEDGGTIKA